MDKHKQFTKHAHEVGSVVNPGSAAAAVPLKHFKFSEADLSSDFTADVDPTAAAIEKKTAPTAVVEPPADVVAAPDNDFRDTTTAKLSTSQVVPFAASAANVGGPGVGGIKGFFANRKYRYACLAAGVIVLATAGLFIGRQLTKPMQVVNDSSQLDESTIFIDSNKNSVGIKAPNSPDGLQVGSTVGTQSRGTANIRMGLIKGKDPSLIFEDSQKNIWQVLGAGGSLQFIQGETTRAKLDENALSLTNAINVGGDTNANANLNVKGNTTLGSAAGNTVTIQANKVDAPNNLNFSNNTLVVETNRGSVAVGATTAGGYKLLVGGVLKVNGNAVLDGQVLAGAGSAKGPSFSFANNTNTGLYQAGLNVIGLAAAGGQVMQIQQGVAFTVNGANFEVDGYLRAGRGSGNPAFQVARFTGTLDGGGAATVPDGLPTGYARVLTVQAFYRGNSNEAIPLNVDFVNSGNFQISGGIPGRQYRATLIYSQDNSGW